MTGPLTLSAHLSNGAAISRAVGDRFPSEDGGRSDRREGCSLPVSLSSPAPDAGVRGTRAECRRRHCEKHGHACGSEEYRPAGTRERAGAVELMSPELARFVFMKAIVRAESWRERRARNMFEASPGAC